MKRTDLQREADRGDRDLFGAIGSVELMLKMELSRSQRTGLINMRYELGHQRAKLRMFMHTEDRERT